MTAQLLAPEAIATGHDVFRPIHYLGAKTRVLDAIEEAVLELASDEGQFIDLFCGSGVVSARLAAHRSVCAVDIQEYARVVTAALLDPQPASHQDVMNHVLERLESGMDALAPLVELEEAATRAAIAGNFDGMCAIVERGSPALAGTPSTVSGKTSPRPSWDAVSRAFARVSPSALRSRTVTRLYGGVYFSYSQALALDAVLSVRSDLDPGVADTWIAAVLGAASDCVSSVGNQFAQPIRPRYKDGRVKPQAIRALLGKRSISPLERFSHWMDQYGRREPARGEHRIIRSDYVDFLRDVSDSIAVVYADPPYTRDHYSRFYHVLETIARGDQPRFLSDTNGTVLRGLYRADRHQSPFCIKSRAPEAFRQLFVETRKLGSALVVSYSPYRTDAPAHPRLLTIEQVRNLARDYYATVEIRSVGTFVHSKLNAAHRNFGTLDEAEVLLICRP